MAIPIDAILSMGLSFRNIHAERFGEGGAGVTASRRSEQSNADSNVLARYSMTIGEVGVEEIEIDSVAGLLNSRLTLFGQSKQLAGYPKALPTFLKKAPPT